MIVECEAYVERFIFLLTYAMIVGTLVWAAADWALRSGRLVVASL